MNAFVAVTDNEWFRHLRSLSEVDEVNFWRPSGRRFQALQPGEVLLFKLHAPESAIAGGGFFAHSTLLPTSIAWETFGEKNGAASIDEMRARIERYRRVPPSGEEYEIGCIILEQPFFFEEHDWFPPPPDFASNTQVGKVYDLRREPHGTKLWEQVQFRLLAMELEPQFEQPEEERPMFGEPIAVRPRLGQGGFRVLVTDTYERRCAVTGERVLPVLEAAHVKPVAQGGTHRVENGLLLRMDLHKLFDRGYVTVTPDHRLRVSRHLREDFHNGEHYRQLDGSEIWVPRLRKERPNPAFLEWHADMVFRG
jgi:putative restriction endonuclease